MIEFAPKPTPLAVKTPKQLPVTTVPSNVVSIEPAMAEVATINPAAQILELTSEDPGLAGRKRRAGSPGKKTKETATRRGADDSAAPLLPNLDV